MSAPDIFRCQPHLVEKVWGGQNIQDLYRKVPSLAQQPIEPGALLGESWEVADLPEGQSYIIDGPLAGQPLQAAVDTWGSQLTGDDAHARFPLLVKILDAQKDLSVQVHPGPDNVHLFEGARSKDECWLVLSAERDGSILHGVHASTTAESFKAALEKGDPVKKLRRTKVRAGDIVHVPPGTIHAICAGVTLLEIQQPSDTTYRVWDYNRPGLDGELRDLHIEQALAVSNFDEQPPLKLEATPLGLQHTLLVDTPFYRVERYKLHTARTIPSKPDAARVLICTRGGCSVRHGETLLELEPGQTCIIPACCDHIRVAPESDKANIVIAHAKAP